MENIELPLIRRIYPRLVMDDIVSDMSVEFSKNINDDILKTVIQRAIFKEEKLSQEFIKEEEMMV